MKPIHALIFILFSSFTYAQTDCKPYIPLEKGSKWEITNYTKKGKETGTIKYEMFDIIHIHNTSIFKIKTTSFDKKGKTTFTNEFEAMCENGKFQFDMAFKIDGALMKSYKDMDVDVEASELEMPTMDVETGTVLKDASLQINIKSDGLPMFKMTMDITDRSVEAKEEIQTPAGKFNCIQLTQKISTKMFLTISNVSKEWYAEGVGMVRSENYSKRGKLMGYSELTKLEL